MDQRHIFSQVELQTQLSKNTTVENVTIARQNVYVSTSDSEILQFTSKYDKNFGYKLIPQQILRKSSSSSKKSSIKNLKAITKWRMLLCIIDNVLTIYDLKTGSLLNDIQEMKGCLMYTFNINTSMLCVVFKKRISFFSWKKQGFILTFVELGEVNLNETPRMVYAIDTGVIVGYRKAFDIIDYTSFQSSRIIETNINNSSREEGKCIAVELPKNALRGETILLGCQLYGRVIARSSLSLIGYDNTDNSNDDKDIIIKKSSILDTENSNNLKIRIVDKLEWSAIPLSVQVCGPFIVSLLISDRIEVHDLSSLSSIQEIAVHDNAPLSSLHQSININGSVLASLGGDVASSDHTSRFCIFYTDEYDEKKTTTTDELNLVDNKTQVVCLAIGAHNSGNGGNGNSSGKRGSFAALNDTIFGSGNKNNTSLNNNTSAGNGLFGTLMIPLATQVNKLVDQENFEDAISVCTAGSSNAPTKAQLIGVDVASIRQKFANALYTRGDFEGSLEQHLIADSSPLDVLKYYSTFIPYSLKTSMLNDGLDINTSTGDEAEVNPKKLSGSILARAAAAVVDFCQKHRNKASIDDKWTLVLIDTVLLNALLQCSPARRITVLQLVSKNNHCHIDSSAVLLASQGNAYVESLLWLYRSRGEHRRVIANLTEDRCLNINNSGNNSSSDSPTRNPGMSVWSRSEMYAWMTEYLSYLWNHGDSDIIKSSTSKNSNNNTSRPSNLVLGTLNSVIEYDASMALGVLCSGLGPTASSSSSSSSSS